MEEITEKGYPGCILSVISCGGDVEGTRELLPFSCPTDDTFQRLCEVIDDTIQSFTINKEKHH